MQVKRKDLLNKLEAMAAGLAKIPNLAQSDCFVFHGGYVVTYNETVACRVECKVDFEGAVHGKELLSLLRKLPQDEVEIGLEQGGLGVRVPGDRAVISMEAKIALPTEEIENPGEWNDLPTNFWDAMGVVRNCCSNKAVRAVLTCVHLTPDWVEASDKFQISRYPVKLKLTRDCLLHREAIQLCTGLEMTQYSETDSWFHFRNPEGLMLSCRRYNTVGNYRYPDLTPFLKVEGKKLSIPKALDEVLDRASDFTDADEQGYVTVELRPDKLRVKGRGKNGQYWGTRDCQFDGGEMSFRINPRLLSEISRKADSAIVAPSRLRVETDKWEYITLIGPVEKE
jgi:hypothetical protein